MILTCPQCSTRYEVDAAKFPPQGRNVRCARCGEVWHATGLALPPEPEPEPEYQPEPAPSPAAFVRPSIQPAARDPEPQLREQGYDDEPQGAPSGETGHPWRQRIGLIAGWTGLAAVVLVIGIVGSVYRQQVVHAWPQSASLYARLGLKVDAAGLDIRNIRYTEAPQDGQVVLTVTGALTNVTDRELPVPQIRVGLVNSDKREIYHWTFAPEVMTLRPGQTTRFVTRLSSPPDGARRLDVRLAKAGE